MHVKKTFSNKTFNFFVVFILTIGFIMPYTAKAYKNISASDVRDLITTSSPVIIVDVRSPQEYYSGKIPTSINIPIEIFESQIKDKSIPKTTQIVVYCQKGNRSSRAAKILDDLGYTNVYNLGSIENWPYDLVK